MRKIFTLLVLCIIGIGCAFAQTKTDTKGDPALKKELKEFKMKFVAQEINLRDDQRSSFTEVYSRMMEEEHAIFRQVGEANRRLKETANPTAADYEYVNSVMVDVKAKAAALEKKYDEEFAKFLTPEQRYQMKEAEQKFRRKMEQMCAKKDGKKTAHKHKK